MLSNLINEDLKTVAASLAPHCRALDGSRIFMTGGTGFFGKWLLHSFLCLRRTQGLDVSLTLLSRDPEQFLASNPCFAGQAGVDFVAGDVRSFKPPADRTYDFVIHGATAASAKLEQESPDEMYDVITQGTRHVLDFVKRCTAKRLLFVSSGAVYGPQPDALSLVPEAYEGIPTTAYGKGKKASEQLCLDASAGQFECVIARPFAFVGPYLPLDIHFAIGNFIRDCLENRTLVIRGDGTPLRSYLYAADLAEWLWMLLLRGEQARAYNVGSERAISICDLAHRVRACAATRNEIVVQGVPVAGTVPARYVPSTERAQKELGLRPRHTLDDALVRTFLWHQGAVRP